MGPLIKLSEMHLALSEKMIHSFLVGIIATSTGVLRFFVLKLDVFSRIYNCLKICWQKHFQQVIEHFQDVMKKSQERYHEKHISNPLYLTKMKNVWIPKGIEWEHVQLECSKSSGLATRLWCIANNQKLSVYFNKLKHISYLGWHVSYI